MTQEIMKKPRPELRFKGFTDDWAQRQFAQLANRISETGNSSTLPWVEYGDIDNTTNALNKDITKRAGVKSGIVFQPGDVLFGKLRPYLRNYLLANFRGVAVGDFWVLRPSNGESLFLYALIQTERYLFAANHCAGSKMPRSDWKFVSNAAFRIPSTIEQQRIGDFFRTLDNLIVAAERKVELLKRKKQAYLQRIFNQDLRFKGFTDDWAQRKINNIYAWCGSGGTPKASEKKYYSGGIPFVSIADVTSSNGHIYKTNKTLSTLGLQNSTAQIFPAGTICLSMYASFGKCALLEISAATSQAFFNMVFKDVATRNFMYAFLTYLDSTHQWNSLVETGTQANLNKRIVADFQSHMPSSPVEQQCIGDFFRTLDDLIVAAEHKVTLLKQKKQSYMQRMFV